MPTALILSSFVAASRIGGAAQQFVLAAHGIDPVLVPTVMFGRSPARGAKGEVTDPAVYRRMLADVEADGLFGQIDLVITGYFACEGQVEVAADVLGRVRAGGRSPVVVVDPILGDAPKGLYVNAGAAEAVAKRLVPIADWITPNLWELGQLSGADVATAPAAVTAARALGARALITSAPARDGEIGLLLAQPGQATLFAHPMLRSPPSGTGDLVAASFGAGLIEGMSPPDAAERAAKAVYLAVRAAQERNSPELPVVALGPQLTDPDAVIRVEILEGA